MDLSTLAEGLDGTPAFRTFLHQDVNPLGHQLKWRVLYDPNKAMRQLHRRLRDYLAGIRPELPHATGSLAGCSPRKNVVRHRYSRYFFLTDIVSAYKTVDLGRLASVLAELDPSLDPEAEQEFLRKYVWADEGGMATGAPACPDLYNLYAGVLLDRVLGAYCSEHGLIMTRYLDDLTFSSSEENGPIGKHKRKAIRAIIRKAGFDLNHAKTKVLDLAKGTIEINGIGLELGGRMFLPRSYHRFLRGFMRRAMTDPDISPPMVAGRMGVFWGATGKGKHLNRTEAKLVRLFYEVRASNKQGGRS